MGPLSDRNSSRVLLCFGRFLFPSRQTGRNLIFRPCQTLLRRIGCPLGGQAPGFGGLNEVPQ